MDLDKFAKWFQIACLGIMTLSAATTAVVAVASRPKSDDKAAPAKA